MNDRLNDCSRTGNLNAFYDIIREDPDILRQIDDMNYVDTPLHLAAIYGHIRFAMQVINLMPSFAKKLNNDLLSPMHLALLNGHTELVLLLVETDGDLVRIKGRGGLTPLHHATRHGMVNLMTNFLLACPESIEDVTIERETVLHIAFKANQLEAIQILGGWLQRICHKDAFQWFENIPNCKDIEGNTVLDLAVAAPNMLQIEVLNLLDRINARTCDGKRIKEALKHHTEFARRGVLKMIFVNPLCSTSITISSFRRIKITNIVSCALTSPSYTSIDKLTTYLKSKTSPNERLAVSITRHKMIHSGLELNILLGVAVLSVAFSYQALSYDRRNLFPDRYYDNQISSSVINGTVSGTAAVVGVTERAALSNTMSYILFHYFNSFVFYWASTVTVFLLPDSFLGVELELLPLTFSFCHFIWSSEIIKTSTRLRYPPVALYCELFSSNYVLCLMYTWGRYKLQRLSYNINTKKCLREAASEFHVSSTVDGLRSATNAILIQRLIRFLLFAIVVTVCRDIYAADRLFKKLWWLI